MIDRGRGEHGTLVCHLAAANPQADIGRLVNTLEARRPNRWRLAEIGADGLAARMPRIVCFDMPIERIEARFQLGQEERAADMAAAATVLDDQGDGDGAALVREYNADRATG